MSVIRATQSLINAMQECPTFRNKRLRDAWMGNLSRWLALPAEQRARVIAKSNLDRRTSRTRISSTACRSRG